MIWLQWPSVTAGAEQCNYCRHSKALQFYTRQVYSTSNRCRHSEAWQFYTHQVYSTSNRCSHSEALQFYTHQVYSTSNHCRHSEAWQFYTHQVYSTSNRCRHSEAWQFYTHQVYSTTNRCRHSEALQFYTHQVYSTSNRCSHSEALQFYTHQVYSTSNRCRHSEAWQFYTHQVYSTSNRCRHSEALQFYTHQVYSTSNRCRHSEAFTVLYTSGVQYFCRPCDCHHWRWGVINWVVSFLWREPLHRPFNSSPGLRRKACSSLNDETTLSLDMSFVWMGHHTSRHPTSPATSPNSWYVLYRSTPSYINTPNLTGHQSKLLTLAEEETRIHFKFFLQHSATVATSRFLLVSPSRLVSQSKLHLVLQCQCSPKAGQHTMMVSRDGWACMAPGCSSSLSPLSLWFPVPPSPKASSLSPIPSSAKRLSSANQIITPVTKTVGLVVHSSANRIITPLTKTVGLVVHSSANRIVTPLTKTVGLVVHSSANQIVTPLTKTVGLVVHSSANQIVTPLTKTVGLVVHSSAS